VADLLAVAVREQGHEALVGLSYEEGLALFERERPDAVFLDLVMPGLTGLDLLRTIRRDSPAFPVIIVTGHASSSEIAEARRLGVLDVLEKPFILNALTPALDRLRAWHGKPEPSR
jgi:DNA-binding response OmpR family regulator